MGRLIPAGPGFEYYRNVRIPADEPPPPAPPQPSDDELELERERLRPIFLTRAACPPDVEIVPTLVLRAGRDQGALFSPAEIKSLQAFFKTEVNSNRLGIIAARQSDPILPALASHCELLKLDLTLGEKLAGPFSGGVENIDAALSDGQTAEEWRQNGLAKLRSSVQAHKFVY